MDLDGKSKSLSWSQLYIGGEKRDDLMIYKLSLHEGLSMFGRADLILYSQKTLMDQNQLRGLLDKPATISLMEKGKNVRYFVGRISGVTHRGIARVLNSSRGYIYQYELVIESILANMKYVRKTRSFLQKTLKDVLSEVLQYYDFSCSLPSSTTTEKYDFYQRNETDESFFLRILRQYGLSFSIQPQAGENPTRENIVISDGSCPYSGAMDPEYRGRLVLKNTETEFLKLNSWTMSEQTGFDKVEFKKAVGAAPDEKAARIWELNQYPLAVTPDDTEKRLNDRIDGIRKNYLRALALNKTDWHGETASLRMIPGGILNVLDFYEQYHGDDSKAVKARITEIRVDLIEKLPGAFSTILDLERTGRINVQFCALDMRDEAPKHMARYEPETAAVSAADSRVEVYRAVVCSDKGETSAVNSAGALEQKASGLGMFFYALPVGMTQPVRVEFSMPVGGVGQGLFRLPRIGDKIQIFSHGDDSFVLMGYLPGNDSMQFMGKKDGTLGKIEQLSNVTALRHNTLGKAADYLDNAAVTPYSEGRKDGIQYSEFGMYSGKQFADTDAPADDAVRVASTGDMFLQSNKDHVETAANFMFSTTSGGNALFSKFKDITFEAEGKITLKTELASLEISDKGINLVVHGYARTSGALDTSFGLKNDSITSKALKQSHSAIASYSASNVIGSELKLNGPTAALTGISTELNTMEKTDWVKSIGAASMLASMHIADVAVPHNPQYVDKSVKGVDHTPPPAKGSYDWIKDLVESLVSTAWELGMDIRSSYVKKNAWKFVTQDAAWKYGTLALIYSDKLSGAKNTAKVSGQLWIANVARNFLKLLLIYINIGKSSSWKTTPSIALGYDAISVASKQLEVTADDFRIQVKKDAAVPPKTGSSELLTAKNFFRVFAALPWKEPKAVAALTADQLKKKMAESKVFIYLGEKGNLKIGCDAKFQLTGKKKIQIESTGQDIYLNASKQIVANAQKFKADFKNAAKIAAMQIKINAQSNMELAGTQLKVNGKAITQIQGGLVKMG